MEFFDIRLPPKTIEDETTNLHSYLPTHHEKTHDRSVGDSVPRVACSHWTWARGVGVTSLVEIIFTWKSPDESTTNLWLKDQSVFFAWCSGQWRICFRLQKIDGGSASIMVQTSRIFLVIISQSIFSCVSTKLWWSILDTSSVKVLTFRGMTTATVVQINREKRDSPIPITYCCWFRNPVHNHLECISSPSNHGIFSIINWWVSESRISGWTIQPYHTWPRPRGCQGFSVCPSCRSPTLRPWECRWQHRHRQCITLSLGLSLKMVAEGLSLRFWRGLQIHNGWMVQPFEIRDSLTHQLIYGKYQPWFTGVLCIQTVVVDGISEPSTVLGFLDIRKNGGGGGMVIRVINTNWDSLEMFFFFWILC